ncbi:MAG: histidine--tRNA ligase [Phycisphaeraceae bacterium]|nr:histidine--tRNA ligase [Phycisphaeraceae bacterium]
MSHTFQAPTGTRDFYPAELNRLRYVQDAWRRTSIRHGFDEIEGPTFEHLDLYTVKSGEGIVSELFSFERFGGEKKFALRPEFTPTLARMYAAKAASLPKPTKWFWMQNCFRAERPQRGRLREFSQWNCDIVGDDSPAVDAECLECCVGLLDHLKLTPSHVRVGFSHRAVIAQLLGVTGATESTLDRSLALLDRRFKMDASEFASQMSAIGIDVERLDVLVGQIGQNRRTKQDFVQDQGGARIDLRPIRAIEDSLQSAGIGEWCVFDNRIVRGLAYYTGMVFEVHETTGAERAIAGGGRYDKLIEMFGGPPTPAVGFGMGDVVLSLVLQDKGLMPDDARIADTLGLRPDVFVFAAAEAADPAVTGVVAGLRRAGLHARRSYKSTRNIGKLVKDAAGANARFAMILHSAEVCSLKNMATQAQEDNVPVGEAAARISAGR